MWCDGGNIAGAADVVAIIACLFVCLFVRFVCLFVIIIVITDIKLVDAGVYLSRRIIVLIKYKEN